MKDYWDSSALVEASMDVGLRTRLRTKGGITRIHTLAECFSALTAGGLAVRLDADAAAQMLDNLAADLEFVELTPPEVLSALKKPGNEVSGVDVSTITCTPWPPTNPERSIC
jgi:hypothetical protein